MQQQKSPLAHFHAHVDVVAWARYCLEDLEEEGGPGALATATGVAGACAKLAHNRDGEVASAAVRLLQAWGLDAKTETPEVDG